MIGLEYYVKFRQEEIRKYAEHQRLINSIQRPPNLGNRIVGKALTQLGESLLNWGTRLLAEVNEKDLNPTFDRCNISQSDSGLKCNRLLTTM
jgi:hypothetical protein